MAARRGSRTPTSRPARARRDGDEEAAADPAAQARSVCLRLLTAQPRTHAELATALRRRGIEPTVIDEVLGRFADVGLIDDAAFASAWVQSRHVGRGLARRALADELRRRGVDDGVVAEAVAVIDTDTEREAARALVRRRLATTVGLPAETRVRRLVGTLARKGYSPGLAYRVVRDELAAERSEAGHDVEVVLDAMAAAEDDSPFL